jgi:diadenosine tetraphosphate (Ap4A) HIT family hydrolase
MADCRSCQLLTRRDAGEAPLWDCIVRTPQWDVVHCDNTSLKGWIVLVARRHVATVSELTDAEASTLGSLAKDVSRALHDLLNCEKTYIVQFAEHPQHHHVHVHVIPRRAQIPDDERGPRIFQHLGVPEEARVSEREMNDIGELLRQRLAVARSSSGSPG